jgi:enoyl-CoA hydratase/carnithine racemase
MSFVLVDKPRPHVTLITLNRPERMNAMAFDVMIPFRETLEAVSHDNDTRVVIVTGAGHGFCSGADLVTHRTGDPEDGTHHDQHEADHPEDGDREQQPE